ncbi:CgeB family protein [Paenibacillus whitsoniae]|uniref:Spore protein YkvP/CgeB glycosyl transferase-like domain-containing protein n=1 Tax=Paenibacillus whitsoniae TaxID=2496558 RepID=A0A3S0I656_9BACL|nr:glycosyltransferase [Paenibacillus whitsoniae]RTE02093.1 hypothetical protein EJQ19_29815 [Paenibacillus whitsoniae]
MKKPNRSTATAASAAAGRHHGFHDGLAQGYRMGRCQHVLDTSQPAPWPMREVSVLFVVQGFDGIDQGIIDGLRQTARVVYTTTAADMLRLAQELRPNLVLVMNGLHVFPAEHPAQIEAVRQLGIRTAIWFADDPYFSDQSVALAPHYDYVFTHETSCLPLYQSAGCSRVYHLPLASNPAVFKPVPVNTAYMSDICFIGTGFPNRLAIINAMTPFLIGKRVVLAGGLWDRLNHYALLRQGIKLHWVPIEETVKYYNGASIVLNIHRHTENDTYNKNSRGLPGYSINPRTYEIAGCGAFQITDFRHELAQFYSPGQDVETFQHPQELVQKMAHYLQHGEERQRIAMNGLRRTLLHHTYAERLTRILNVVFS